MAYQAKFDGLVVDILSASGLFATTGEMLAWWPVGSTGEWVILAKERRLRPADAACIAVGETVLTKVKDGELSFESADCILLQAKDVVGNQGTDAGRARLTALINDLAALPHSGSLDFAEECVGRPSTGLQKDSPQLASSMDIGAVLAQPILQADDAEKQLANNSISMSAPPAALQMVPELDADAEPGIGIYAFIFGLIGAVAAWYILDTGKGDSRAYGVVLFGLTWVTLVIAKYRSDRSKYSGWARVRLLCGAVAAAGSLLCIALAIGFVSEVGLTLDLPVEALQRPVRPRNILVIWAFPLFTLLLAVGALIAALCDVRAAYQRLRIRLPYRKCT